jgi:two-component sensor histidine kinase
MTSRLGLLYRLTGAILLTLGCFAIQLPIESRSVGDPFAVFLASIFMVALLFGRPPGAAAVVLSSLLSALFLEPLHTLQLLKAFDLLQIQIFALLATGAVLLADQIRRTLIAQSEENESLSAEERRKSLRLREVSHRVANSFSSLDALIRLRARGSSDPKIAFAFEQASELIHVVARLSRRLNNPDDSKVETRVFVADVCEDLKACAPPSTELDYTAENHQIPLNIAIPLGLIINELVTNALKYAFPDGRRGRLDVSLVKRGRMFVLAVEDDGVGMSGTTQGGGIGLPLLKGLAQSLGGKIEIRSGPSGTLASVTFAVPYPQPAPEPEERPPPHHLH